MAEEKEVAAEAAAQKEFEAKKLKEFYLFPLLPLELQRMIWKEAAPKGTRLYHLRLRMLVKVVEQDKYQGIWASVSPGLGLKEATRDIRAFASICRETQKHVALTRPGRLQLDRPYGVVQFNAETDVICLRSNEMSKSKDARQVFHYNPTTAGFLPCQFRGLVEAGWTPAGSTVPPSLRTLNLLHDLKNVAIDISCLSRKHSLPLDSDTNHMVEFVKFVLRCSPRDNLYLASMGPWQFGRAIPDGFEMRDAEPQWQGPSGSDEVTCFRYMDDVHERSFLHFHRVLKFLAEEVASDYRRLVAGGRGRDAELHRQQMGMFMRTKLTHLAHPSERSSYFGGQYRVMHEVSEAFEEED